MDAQKSRTRIMSVNVTGRQFNGFVILSLFLCLLMAAFHVSLMLNVV